MTAGYRIRPFELPARQGARFGIITEPRAIARAAVMMVPPLFEEMNRSRAMLAAQARRLAEAGCLVMQLDLFGTGDSDGELSDASWALWLDDLSGAWQYLATITNAPRWWFSMRAGSLLMADCSARDDVEPAHGWCLWQPVLRGEQCLTQFLRLRAMAARMHGTAAEGEDTASLTNRLLGGETLEVAGYCVPPEVARGLHAARLDASTPAAITGIFEVASGESPQPSAPVQRLAQAWQGQSGVTTTAVSGVQFWQSVEDETAPALLNATCGWMQAAIERPVETA